MVPRVREAPPDLILLDLMLPGRDDYVCKPFAPREAVARVKAQLRRVEMLTRPAGEVDADDGDGLVLDADRYEARLEGHALRLTVGEFRLLAALCRHPGRILSRSRLLEELYDDHRVVTNRSVDTHVKNLRRKLASGFYGRQFIESVYGVGYRYEPQ